MKLQIYLWSGQRQCQILRGNFRVYIKLGEKVVLYIRQSSNMRAMLLALLLVLPFILGDAQFINSVDDKQSFTCPQQEPILVAYLGYYEFSPQRQ